MSLLRLLPAGLLLALAARAADPAALIVTPVIYTQPEVKSAIITEAGRVFGVQVSAVQTNRELTAFIVDRLVNARKFTVLERTRLESALREIEFAASDYADPAKVARVGQMLRADFVLIPEIRRFSVRQSERTVPYVNITQVEFEAVLGLSSRVVDVQTGQIVSSRIDDVRLRVRPRRQNPAQEATDFVERVYAQCAEDLVGRVLDAVYPLKVIEITGSTFIVNRGADFLREGQRLLLFKTGAALVDPDTGRSLGASEVLVGSANVENTNPRFAEVRLIESREPVRVGFILRVVPPDPPADQARKVDW